MVEAAPRSRAFAQRHATGFDGEGWAHSESACARSVTGTREKPSRLLHRVPRRIASDDADAGRRDSGLQLRGERGWKGSHFDSVLLIAESKCDLLGMSGIEDRTNVHDR